MLEALFNLAGLGEVVFRAVEVFTVSEVVSATEE